MATTYDGRYEIGTGTGTTVLEVRDGSAQIVMLAGWETTGRMTDVPIPAAGTALVTADGRRWDGRDLVLSSMSSNADEISLRFDIGASGLVLLTSFTVDPETGVVRRTDALTNEGTSAVVVSRALARVSLARGRYELYAQESRWCHENQGCWRTVAAGATELTHLPGRSTEGATPFIAVRRAGERRGLAAHLLPRGNYTIRVETVPASGDLPYAVLELGLSDRDLWYPLAPGSRLELPSLLFQCLPTGEPHEAAPALHRYLLASSLGDRKPAPVVYNTWFDQFDRLEVPRLRSQLAAAKDMGCEVFVIDAGWFGSGAGSWATKTGDWSENEDAAFFGKMKEFAEEVRAAGLGFGLWIEPERIGADAPIRREHPEWFIPVGDVARVDLDQEPARRYVQSEIERLVETYELAWLKVDFNFSLGYDATGGEHASYYDHWYRLMDEIRRAHPGTVFEGCASGGLRCEIESLAHFDAHFITDTVNPVDTIRISEGAWLRLPPGTLSRWAVVRSAGQAVPRYGAPMHEAPGMVVVPRGALWEPCESVDLEFALAAALPGVFGLSGDPASLCTEERRIIRQATDYYKRNRDHIVRAAGHLLTPPQPLASREGWAAVQLDAGDVHIVIAYRLGSCGAPPSIRPRGLDAGSAYHLSFGFEETPEAAPRTGTQLMDFGVPVAAHMPDAFHGRSALVCTIRRA
jgi:alpha-galactosidase